MGMYEKMNEERQRWHDQLDAMNQKREADKNDYYQAKAQNMSDVLDVKRQALDASSAASGARADAATARLGMAQNDAASRADARTQTEQDKQDKANQGILDSANA